jgi:hypothetical protein
MVDAVDSPAEVQAGGGDAAADRVAPARSGAETPGKELRCTFCGMTACWTSDDGDASGFEDPPSAG